MLGHLGNVLTLRHETVLVGRVVHAVEQTIIASVVIEARGTKRITFGLLLDASLFLAQNAILSLVAADEAQDRRISSLSTHSNPHSTYR